MSSNTAMELKRALERFLNLKVRPEVLEQMGTLSRIDRVIRAMDACSEWILNESVKLAGATIQKEAEDQPEEKE